MSIAQQRGVRPLSPCPREQWTYIAATNRWFAQKGDKHLFAGDDGHTGSNGWFSVYERGVEIAQGDGFEGVDDAKVAAEQVE